MSSLTLKAIEETRDELWDVVSHTPVVEWPIAGAFFQCEEIEPPARLSVKLEHLQRGGSFKIRGALSVMRALDAQTLGRGVVAVSAGNHAIAVAEAAATLGCSARVVMPETTSEARIERCRARGADVVTTRDIHRAFERAEDLARASGATIVHPFEGERTSLGTATLGLEWHAQCGPLDLVAIAIGGGGLASGVASALRRLRPELEIWGVEPVGAAAMSRSFEAGEPVAIDKVETIADSLGAPFALPYSFALCRAALNGIVTVDDLAIRKAMRLMFEDLGIAAEPAAAAAVAALRGPLARRVAGKRAAVVCCGSTIDAARFHRLIDFDPDA